MYLTGLDIARMDEICMYYHFEKSFVPRGFCDRDTLLRKRTAQMMVTVITCPRKPKPIK